MSELRDVLIARYATHYDRGECSVDPRMAPPSYAPVMDAMFGKYLDRLPPGGKVLDVGCGSGHLVHWLSTRKKLTAVGVDASDSQVAIARRALPGVDFVCADALPYMRERRGQFAGIFCFNVLEHISGDALLAWMQAAREALVPGGFFACQVPNAANLFGSQLRYIDLTHERSFTVLSLLQLFDAAGYADVHIVPLRPADFGARVRMFVERALHRVLYRVCGHTGEKVFTRTLAAVGITPSVQTQVVP